MPQKFGKYNSKTDYEIAYLILCDFPQKNKTNQNKPKQGARASLHNERLNECSFISGGCLTLGVHDRGVVQPMCVHVHLDVYCTMCVYVHLHNVDVYCTMCVHVHLEF